LHCFGRKHLRDVLADDFHVFENAFGIDFRFLNDVGFNVGGGYGFGGSLFLRVFGGKRWSGTSLFGFVDCFLDGRFFCGYFVVGLGRICRRSVFLSGRLLGVRWRGVAASQQVFVRQQSDRDQYDNDDDEPSDLTKLLRYSVRKAWVPWNRSRRRTRSPRSADCDI